MSGSLAFPDELPLGDSFLSFLPFLAVGHLSWGFQRLPLHRHEPLASTPARFSDVKFPSHFDPRFGPTLPGVGSRSTFTVSHRLDGLLRAKPCGFVAPRCRSWGPPCFGSHWSCPRGLSSGPSSSARAPFEAFSSSSAASLGPSRGGPALLSLTPAAPIRGSSPSSCPVVHLAVLTVRSEAGGRSSGSRALGRCSSSLRHPGVSTKLRSLLPWVSHSARDPVPEESVGRERLPSPVVQRPDASHMSHEELPSWERSGFYHRYTQALGRARLGTVSLDSGRFPFGGGSVFLQPALALRRAGLPGLLARHGRRVTRGRPPTSS